MSALNPMDSAGRAHRSWLSRQRASSACCPLRASILEKCKWEVGHHGPASLGSTGRQV